MANYHTTFKNAHHETTEWEDLQVKYGNYQPREKSPPPPVFEPKQDIVKDAEWIDNRDEEELSDLEDEFEDDTFLAEYRRKRLEEMRTVAKRKASPGQGEVTFIRRDDFVKQVTEASIETWVVVFLFKEGHVGCGLMDQCLLELAKKYQSAKFVKIISTECIARYPDALLPTLIVYREGKPQKTIDGIGAFGGKRMTPESVAFELNKLGPVCTSGDGDEERSQAELMKNYMERLLQERDAKEDMDDTFD